MEKSERFVRQLFRLMGREVTSPDSQDLIADLAGLLEDTIDSLIKDSQSNRKE